MTRTELQAALRQLRSNGHTLTVKLTASNDLLQLEYDRLTKIEELHQDEQGMIENIDFCDGETEQEPEVTDTPDRLNWSVGQFDGFNECCLLSDREHHIKYSELSVTPVNFNNSCPIMTPWVTVPTVDMVRNFRISLLALIAVVIDALAVIENNEKAFRQRNIRYAGKISKQVTNATCEFIQGFLYGLSQDYRDTLQTK